MCQQLNLLAKLSDGQYIACCEHGVVHLYWSEATFHLRPVDFERVVWLLERSTIQPYLTRICDQGRCCLVRQTNGCYQLWLGQAILLLLPADLSRLIKVARLALEQLKSQSIQLWLAGQGYDQTFQARPGDCFSAN